MEEPTSRWLLLVEDNADDERLATRTFLQSGRKEDWRVARDGEQAIETLRSHPPPALVFLDLKLPRLSGFDVLRTVREDARFGRTPVVMLTSSDEKRDLDACYALGCNAYLRKPVDFGEYTHDLKLALEFWLGVNRLP